MKTKLFSRLLIIIAIGVFFISSILVALIADWWWFSEVGFTEVFITSLVAKATLGLAVGLFAALFLVANFLIATRSKIIWTMTIPGALPGHEISMDSRRMRKLGMTLSLVAAFFIGLIASASWQDVLKFLSAAPFGYADPLFGKDAAFYVFSLPVYFLGLGLAKALIVISLVGCGIIYVLRGSLSLASVSDRLKLPRLAEKIGEFQSSSQGQPDSRARLHIGILLALFLSVIAAGTYLSLYNLLTAQSGPIFGAAFTDTNVMVVMLSIAAFVYGFAALCALYFGVRGAIRPFLGALVLVFFVNLASGIVPSIFQKFIVAPNELVKETPFIKYNIEATRRAYGLDNVEEKMIAGDTAITAADIASNNLTIKNIRLWDREPLLSTFSQIQEIRTYYEFASVDNDRYSLDGEIRQIMLSPRELSSESLPNRNWINERLTFTHGYGVAAGPVNQVTPEGLPVLFVKDLPPKSEVKELAVSRPEIYYGELVNDYAIVKTKSKEFDYPKGEENVFSTYEGKGGVEINSFARRLIYALQFKSLKLLLSGDITRESRILYHRTIRERVEKIAPFFTYDKDPYLVITNGKLSWILDAYTSTDRYPYSQPSSLNGNNINYIRNSVKAIVDAYDGSVTFYQADPADPIMNTYAKIFPKSFRELKDMPKELIPHLRYPEDIFTLQTAIYATYHMDDPQIFYNKEDQWEVPSVAQGGGRETNGKTSTMTPRHMIMKLPGEKKEEFILMLPFTPRAKDNLSAWMVAKNDGEQYGKLIAYRFPKDKLVFGPKQVIGRINQDAEVSRQISLWDQRGSQVIQGSLLVIPIEESLVYVRPLYLKAESGKIPELKRVIVAYENKIAMEETLEAGLEKIFGTSSGLKKSPKATPVTAPSSDTTKENLAQQANSAFEAALRAQREGDWSRYGDEIKKLGDLLNKLKK